MRYLSLLRSAAARRALIVASHLVLAAAAFYLAFALRFEFDVPAAEFDRFVNTLPFLLGIRLAAGHWFRMDRGYWRHFGVYDAERLALATAVGSILFPLLLLAAGRFEGMPRSVLALEGVLFLALSAGARMAARTLRERTHLGSAVPGRRTFVIGAGEAGEQILRQLLHDRSSRFQVVGLIDDDPEKRGCSLHGVRVVGTADELRGLVTRHRVCQALIAIPSATSEELRRLVERCVETGVEVQLLPPLKDLVTTDLGVNQVRDVQIEDLLGREPVTLDLQAIEPELAGRVVLVTGAGGSIGAELARQIARFNPRELILVDRAESPLHAIHHEVSAAHPAVAVVPVLASITNGERLQRVFDRHRPDCVFHAAAYKHVPMLEWNMVEGVWNNVIGTLRTARCAARSGAAKFVLISTDKAVNPASVLGATKFIAERIVLELPSLRASATDFRVVRFGNVLGSDGSVVPLFKRQLAAGGPLTVTHPEVRRFFMTIPEAVALVLQAAALPEATGRISLLEMGTQVRILDLAEQLIRLAGLLPYKDVEIVFTGLRPGEKLEEELLGPTETAHETCVDKIRVLDRNGAHGDELARRLRYLTRVTARRDEQALVRALEALAPEYHPSLPSYASPGNRFHHNGRNGVHQNGRNGNGIHQNGSNGHNGVHQNGRNGVHKNRRNGNGIHQNGSNGHNGSQHNGTSPPQPAVARGTDLLT